ncbi:MAG: helix-turn-helix domain-containing protein [Patescibacteria group bacterium]|jgi:sugar-specific transcriptional regulator TrmB
MLEKELQKLGLSDKEAKVYLSSMELGPSPVQSIASKAGVNRATTYVMIESLIERGLMSSFEKGKKKFFTAESPLRLLALLRKEEAEIKDKMRNLEEIIPHMNTLLANTEERPRVRFYEGKEGLRAVQEDFLRTHDKKIETIYSADYIRQVFTDDERKEYVEKRMEKGIKVRSIYTFEKGTLVDKTATRCKIPTSKFPLFCDIIMYGNNVAITSLKGRLFGIIVESKEFADTMRSIFELSWEAAEKYKSEEKK